MNTSCEIPSETLSFCTHGTPVKFECAKCSLEHRLKLLESQMKTSNDMYIELTKSIQVLHEHKIRQIDENRKISKRIDQIERDLIDISSPLLERIEEIENGLINRIGILGTALQQLSDENHKLKKAPHKCPVCEGEGRIVLKVPLVTKTSTCYSINCVPCEGKGIIWG